MDEFREVVTVLKPKVIGITEFCSEGKSEGDINLEGFTLLTLLQSAPCTELNNTDFESSVWSIITLNNRDKQLVGCIYKVQLNKITSCLLV